MNRFKGCEVILCNKLSLDIEVIIREYASYVYKVIDNIALNSLTKQDKEDLVSETFYLLWKNQDKINSNMKSYMATIARNLCYQALKRENDTFSLDNNLDTYTENFETRIFILEQIKRLNKNERKVFNLYYIKGYKIKEISKIMKKSVGNIKVILYRIRLSFKEGR